MQRHSTYRPLHTPIRKRHHQQRHCIPPNPEKNTNPGNYPACLPRTSQITSTVAGMKCFPKQGKTVRGDPCVTLHRIASLPRSQAVAPLPQRSDSPTTARLGLPTRKGGR
ncbi:hypothetical protein M758_2G174400 [Ceratodon purpureus]|nr:hypothetical protein M758_2G174400 [Ceratodon purpureus]